MKKQSAETDTAMSSWLQLHDPRLYTGPAGIHTPEALSAMAAMTTGSGSVTPAPSQAAVTGTSAQTALLGDQKAQQALTQYGALSAQFQSEWATDLVGGAVTLSELARNAAGYQPQLISNNGANAAAFQSYLGKIGSCPLFVLQMSDTLQYTRDTSDWNEVIDAIADTFTGIQADDKASIVRSLKSLAQAASSNMSTTETENLFVQSALDVDDVVTLYLYSSSVSFVETKGKGYDTKQTTFDITRIELLFQSALWPEYVPQVAAMFTSSVNSWLLNNSTSTTGTKPIPALQPTT